MGGGEKKMENRKKTKTKTRIFETGKQQLLMIMMKLIMTIHIIYMSLYVVRSKMNEVFKANNQKEK